MDVLARRYRRLVEWISELLQLTPNKALVAHRKQSLSHFFSFSLVLLCGKRSVFSNTATNLICNLLVASEYNILMFLLPSKGS